MKIRKTLNNLITKPVITLIEIISWPLWILDFLKKNKQIRNILIYFTITSAAVLFFLGTAVYFMGLMTLGQIALTMAMMIGQFIVLFSFLSSTKTIEIYPGTEGAFTFENDYFGNTTLVTAMRQWIQSLSKEGKAHLDEMGAEAIHGILLEGPPGTGKTLLAQCLASESGAAFFGTSGTDYQAMFIGVGPLKIMKMYGKARRAAAEHGAAIVFIDELDAIGGNRGGVSGSNPSSSSGSIFGGGGLGVLSKLLTELDGTKESGRRLEIVNAQRKFVGIPEIAQGLVLTMGATNRREVLDPALLRPGRIDKIIEVPPPDKTSRRLIIEGYLRKIKHDAADVDVPGMVEDTQGVTPAQLASIIQRSAPRYAMNDKRLYINQEDLDQAFQEDLVGLANPIVDWDPIQKRQVASHEAGHAVLSLLLRPNRRITTVSIIRRGGGILGYLRDVHKKEVFSQPLADIAASLMVSLAGHYATELILGEFWEGTATDFDHVRHYLEHLAYAGEFGGIPFEIGPMGSPWMSTRLKTRADNYLQRAIQGTRNILIEHRTLLEAITKALIDTDELTSRAFYKIAKENGYELEG